MKKIDVCEIQKRRYENYLKEEKNLIVTRTEHGYSVSNLNKATTYTVSKNPEDGNIECECKDFRNYKKQGIYIRCKHIICVGRKCSNKRNNIDGNPSIVSVNSIASKEQVGNKPIIETINNIIKEESSMSNNNINKFNPQAYMTKVKGKDYLEVKYRIHWFRQEHPNWDIRTEIVNLDLGKGISLVKADILDDTGRHLSSGMKMEYQKNFFDYCEKSETGAIGRALACLGYGTLQCFELEEGIEKGRIVDAPITPPATTAKTHSTTISTNPKAQATTSKTPTINNTTPIVVPTVSPSLAKPSATPTTQPAGSIQRQGGNGKGNNGNGGNGKTHIENIIDRW